MAQGEREAAGRGAAAAPGAAGRHGAVRHGDAGGVAAGRAQPAPNARPTGGVGGRPGSATISTAPSTTTITQSSQRAAINWQSFNVGSQQTVDFVQPSSSAVALNRVVGPNPSQIAGQIDANGQIILINQSGVIFYKGAQVNTAGLIVSAAGMSDRQLHGRPAWCSTRRRTRTRRW